MQGVCTDLELQPMGHIRDEKEVDEIIEKLMSKGKGNYITQSVTFKKNSPRQMELLKKALMYSESFSGLARELLNEKFSDNGIQTVNVVESKPVVEAVVKRDTGNFLDD